MKALLPLLAFALIATVCFGGANTLAQSPANPPSTSPSTIEVFASGNVTTEIEVVELRFRISAAKGLASEAMDRFSALKSKTRKAMAELEIEGLEVRTENFRIGAKSPGSEFDHVMIMGGDGRATPKTQIEASAVAVVSIPHAAQEAAKVITSISNVIDTAVDLKLDLVGQQPMVNPWMAMHPAAQTSKEGPKFFTLKVKDLPKLEREARAKAVANARAQADELAGLSGLKVLGAHSIKVVAVPSLGQDPNRSDRGQVSVRLQIVFRTEPA